MKYFWQRIKNLFKPFEQPTKGVLFPVNIFDSAEKGKWYLMTGFWKKDENGNITVDDVSVFQLKTRNKKKQEGIVKHYKLNTD